MHGRESVTIRCACELDADTPAIAMYTTQREERTGIAQHNTHWLLANPREQSEMHRLVHILRAKSVRRK